MKSDDKTFIKTGMRVSSTALTLPSHKQLNAFLLCMFLIIAPTAVCADVVVMKNGDRITGVIKKIWRNQLYIDPEYAGEFTVKLDAVAYIESDSEFNIELPDGRKIFGRLGTDENRQTVLISAAASEPLSITEIKRLNKPSTHFSWSLHSDLSANISRGNTDSSNFRSYSIGRIKLGAHRHQLEAAFDREQKDRLSIKEQDEVKYGYSWYFRDDWFTLMQLGWRRDPQRELINRWTLGAGFGHQFWDDAVRELQLSLSIDAISEEIGMDEEESLAPHWRFRARHRFFSDKMEIFHHHDLWTFVVGRDNTIFESSSGIRYNIIGNVYTNLQADFDYETNPANNARNEDLTMLLGIGIDFD